METINFNEFSHKERYEIIKAFLVKMRGANTMPSKDLHVQKFFEHYLRKFYKVPEKLVNDIAYCQRAMKSHLATHQTIVDVFGKQEDADPVTKNNYLHELEDMLYELNAECQYLLLRLQDHIDRFCLAFIEQDVKPDERVIQDIVSQSIVPLIVAPELSLKPHFVMERPTEDQLLKKYFIIDAPEEQAPPPVKAIKPPPELPQLQSSADTANVVMASRLNLQAALKRARSQCKPVEKAPEPDQPKGTKELFLQSVGLCTHKEHQKLKLSMIQLQKRKPKPTEKTK
ncbi:uncharacterized protein LOC110179030 [Drosophila serrata]|uniref:uncharacterized protein LOC110179030 n=1 Tax=Drosophila serrata TaxID=7274 RepID=UPI000A1CF8D9|nr:uncharacterized protein LOC110179030 [Drosophila serrata]